MTWVDWAVIILMALSVLEGLSEGFFRSVFSLGGLLLGLVIAAWNYDSAASLLMPLVRIERVADAIGFLLVALLVMVVASIVGAFLAKAMHQLGLGFVDKIAGAAFGLVKGALLVMLAILVAVAFFPRADWLAESRLARLFFGVCHVSTHISPDDLAQRVREGLKIIERESPPWLHPGGGGL
jgi:membrane protein required for colicin V production